MPRPWVLLLGVGVTPLHDDSLPQVAALAGIPSSITAAARQAGQRLEENPSTALGATRQAADRISHVLQVVMHAGSHERLLQVWSDLNNSAVSAR